MRSDLKQVNGGPRGRPRHLALAYDGWAPVDETGEDAGKVARGDRAKWLQDLCDVPIAEHYTHFFNRWDESFSVDCKRRLHTKSRLLVGHGNASATEVGITLHHTWGVPFIPGSALKGLCAHYVAQTYGNATNPAAPADEENIPSGFRGRRWDQDRKRIIAAPGGDYSILFGAPDVDDEHPASAGHVVFHDALYDPGSETSNKPFAVDVITVHQLSYYGQGKPKVEPGVRWPNDYASPNPVGFITVRPGARFLIALTGPEDWTALAMHFLLEAIDNWGIGAKTSAGYGRGHVSP